MECEAILEELETVDDEADAFGIDFVKNKDPHAARQYNIYNTPALVYFRRMSPVVYDGDLMDGEMILSWLTSQDVFETKDEIEEVNRKLLEKLLDENEFVAVYFCKAINSLFHLCFIIFPQTRTTVSSVTRWSLAWRRLTTRRTLWTSPSSRSTIPATPRNTESANCRPSFTSGENSPASTEVTLD